MIGRCIFFVAMSWFVYDLRFPWRELPLVCFLHSVTHLRCCPPRYGTRHGAIEFGVTERECQEVWKASFCVQINAASTPILSVVMLVSSVSIAAPWEFQKLIASSMLAALRAIPERSQNVWSWLQKKVGEKNLWLRMRATWARWAGGLVTWIQTSNLYERMCFHINEWPRRVTLIYRPSLSLAICDEMEFSVLFYVRTSRLFASGAPSRACSHESG